MILRRRLQNSALWVKLAVAAFVMAIVGILGMLILFAYYAKDLPAPDKVVRRSGFSTRIFDRNGKLLFDVYDQQKRTPVDISQMPLQLQKATIAIEDKNFYQHGGFDVWGIARAMVRIAFTGHLQSGSTLTQQLVKNTLLTSRQTLDRKLREFILTVQVERKYTKDQILQMYLNESPYGGTAWGVGAAAETYFNKPVSQLSLVESAILAGLPQSPSRYSPFGGGLYEGRTQEVLRRMREDGYITKDQEQVARKELSEIKFATESGAIKAPHFVFYVKQQLVERYGEEIVEQGGLQVTTTLDLDLQDPAQKVVAEEIDKVKNINITNGSVVAMDPKTGQILAMVGSRGWDDPEYDGKYNVATASRQPGSAIKPVVYLAGLRKGYTAATLLMDTKTSFPGGDKPEYVPENYDLKFRGPILVREALGNSINVPAVKMLSLVGIRDTLELAYDMGLTTLKPTKETLSRLGLSMALGGGEVKLLELATAYSAFANQGKKIEPVSILKVVDNTGKVLEEWKPTALKEVISPEEAYIISSILSDPKAREITFGPRSAINISGRSVAVKTGTTNDRRDNWTIGWTPTIIVGVWVGNNDNTPMKSLSSGVSGAAPIWRRIILAALAKLPEESFTVPAGVVTMDVDKISGYAAHDGFEAKTEYFIKGTEPTSADPVHKLVRNCTGDLKEYLYFKENDPFMENNVNKWQEGIDKWLTEQSDSKYHPPADGDCGNQIWITVAEPGDKARINSNDVKIRLDITSPDPINKVEFYVDGNLKDTATSSPWERTINMSNGYHKIDVKAFDNKDRVGSRFVEIGVNQDFAYPSPTP